MMVKNWRATENGLSIAEYIYECDSIEEEVEAYEKRIERGIKRLKELYQELSKIAKSDLNKSWKTRKTNQIKAFIRQEKGHLKFNRSELEYFKTQLN